MLTQRCLGCNKLLPIEMFSKDRTKKNGTRARCKECSAEQRRKNGTSEKQKQYAAQNPVKVITQQMIRDAKNRSKSKGLPFNIDREYLREMVGENAQLASHCPIFGIRLEWSRQRNNGNAPLPNSPSIDRINPDRGYVKGNIWIISHRANTIKSDATHEELRLVTEAVGKAIVDSLEF